jgi:hypothetical protein
MHKPYFVCMYFKHIYIHITYFKPNIPPLAHINETLWIKNNEEKAIKVLTLEFKTTDKLFPEDELKESLSRCDGLMIQLKNTFQISN